MPSHIRRLLPRNAEVRDRRTALKGGGCVGGDRGGSGGSGGSGDDGGGSDCGVGTDGGSALKSLHVVCGFIPFWCQ
jgi:hypothetical protein